MGSMQIPSPAWRSVMAQGDVFFFFFFAFFVLFFLLCFFFFFAGGGGRGFLSVFYFLVGGSLGFFLSLGRVVCVFFGVFYFFGAMMILQSEL